MRPSFNVLPAAGPLFDQTVPRLWRFPASRSRRPFLNRFVRTSVTSLRYSAVVGSPPSAVLRPGSTLWRSWPTPPPNTRPLRGRRSSRISGTSHGSWVRSLALTFSERAAPVIGLGVRPDRDIPNIPANHRWRATATFSHPRRVAGVCPPLAMHTVTAHRIISSTSFLRASESMPGRTSVQMKFTARSKNVLNSA